MTGIPAELTLRVDQEIEINAAADKAFASLLQQLSDGFEPPNVAKMNMRLEPVVGGKWFRDLGDGQGHLWGHVQVIKRPTLLEIYGPMFMSYPALSHLQFRLTEKNGKTLLTLRHQAMGLIQEDHRKGVAQGWGELVKGVKQRAERN